MTPVVDSLERLIARAHGGCSDALGAILERFRPYLLQVAFEELDSQIQVKESPSDLVQKSFLEASAAFGEFQGVAAEAVQAWLRQILLNNLRDIHDHYRADKRQIAREVDRVENVAGECLENITPPAEKFVRREQAALLETAFAKLEPEDQQLIVWRHREGRSFPQIAEALQITEEAARKRWVRAIEALRQLTKEEFLSSVSR